MIGDAVSDIRAARAAGIKSVAVTWGHQSRQKLSQEAPDLIIDEPEDLANYFSGYSGK
jgi:phosphoglycolate phosphatase-like HAD superfamily hydrolase